MADTEITIKSTKAEMMEALNNALKRAEMAERGSLNPEKEEKDKIEKKAVESAKKAVEQNIFSKELNDKFNDLQVAIAAEENRLSELYGVGSELQKLALAIDAGKESIAKLEAQRSEKEDAAAKRQEELSTEFARKSDGLKSENEAYVKKLKLDRERENEEYQYNLSRTREKEENAWADKCAVREAELLKREARAKELLAEAENKAEYMCSLEEKVKSIPALLQSEKETAVLSVTETLRKEYEYKATLTGKDYQNSIARLEDKVAFLGKELDSANNAVGSLQAKLDKAYVEIRELATKTVESASGVKIISSENKNL
jgi:uncharacterized coiled-coil protein SlyX